MQGTFRHLDRNVESGRKTHIKSRSIRETTTNLYFLRTFNLYGSRMRLFMAGILFHNTKSCLAPVQCCRVDMLIANRFMKSVGLVSQPDIVCIRSAFRPHSARYWLYYLTIRILWRSLHSFKITRYISRKSSSYFCTPSSSTVT
jgi:hypothetical protein